jgi:EpsD family peptidyl-prolyl cis-trans isomerase
LKTKIPRSTRLAVLLIATVLVVSLPGCDQARDEKRASQVAAQVNGDEITIHQINNVLGRTPNVPVESAAKAKREILERLLNQQLAKQQAIEKKLDRTPAVVQAIESAKSEILARAYFEQIAGAQPKPTPEEVKRYYMDNPELFSQRRIFHIEEIVARTKPDLAAGLREQAGKARSLQSIAAWLKGRGVAFVQNERILGAEEVPLASLRALQKMKEGDVQVTEGPDRVAVLRVVSIRSAPIDESTAAPRIQQFLLSQKANQAVAAEVKRLRETGKIEYRGEFASDASPPAPAAPPIESSASPPQAAPFDKGLRGLK